MTTGIYWQVFTDAGTRKANEKLLERFSELVSMSPVDLVSEPYDKGGMRNVFTTRTASGLSLQEMIAVAQSVGYAWTLTGDIHSELDLWCNRTKISGITSIQMTVELAD